MGKYGGIKTLEVLEGADNYNKWIAQALLPHIKSPALEIGAGMGNISEYMTGLKNLVLTDNDPYLVELLGQKFHNKKNIYNEALDISGTLGTVKNKFKTIYSVNVLEHIKDDKKALKNISLLLEKGGRFVCLVPAKQFAFTKLDKNLGHYRRYEKNELEDKLSKANFKIEVLEYFNVLGLASWMIRDWLNRNDTDLKKSHVKTFDAIVPLLRLIEPKHNLPMGISLIAVGVKK